MKHNALACLLAAVIAPQTVVWGGDHVELEVTESGARIEFDCAHGTIDEPVRVDTKGAFALKGTLTPERGPSRDGDASRAPKVTYAGTIIDDTMTLRVVIAGEDQPGPAYQLGRGRRGNVRKCR